MKFHTKNWHDDHANVRSSTYSDGSTKLTVYGRRNDVLCVATVSSASIDASATSPNHAFMPTYDDWDGVIRSLQDAGYIQLTYREPIETGINTRDPLRSRPVREVRILKTD